MPRTHKFAKDLAAGDQVQISNASAQSMIVTVLAAVPSVQVLRRPIMLVTFRSTDGREIHRQYYANSSIAFISEGATDS